MHDHAKCQDLFAELSAYLDGELDPALCDRIASHVGSCEPCLRFLDSLRDTRDAVRRLGGQSALPDEECRRLLAECMDAFRAKTSGGGAGAP